MIESREDRSLTQELIAGLLASLLGQQAVIFDFFEGAQSPLQPNIVCEVDGSGAALTDPFADLVALAQDFSMFQETRH